MDKRWNLLYEKVNPDTVSAIQNATSVSPLLALLLAVRGVGPKEAADYLAGGLSVLHDPFLLKDMDKAVERIRKAMRDKEKITIYGDYDVDGISSVSMLLSYFRTSGADCSFYIPDRETEGYGVNEAAVRKIRHDGTKLLITVDTGITACRETELAASLGMDVIITDHHSVGASIPDALAVINPKQADCPYPFKGLCGAGVAFKLLTALCGDTKKAVTEYCDIAALATIADVVPLTGENRALTALGLRKMRKMPSVGFSAIFEASGISAESLSSYQISFCVAPRLNAAGRMGSCTPAVRLLVTDSESEAKEIALELDNQNTARKTAGDGILEEALALIEKGDYADKKVVVLAHEGWHHGIIGIIASKLTEQLWKPTILISKDGNEGKGSGRSIPGLNLFEALQSAAPLLSRFGGHALAAGLTVPTENIAALSDALCEYANAVLTEEQMTPSIDIDAPLDISLPLLQIAEMLEVLEPFGVENTKPVFLLSDACISSVRTSKDNKHLFLRLFKDGTSVECVAFGKGSLSEDLHKGDSLDVVGTLNINNYGGQSTPQIILQDLRRKQ